ncbi:HSP70/90 co-chaperone [Tieghemiomyces parasiticus]|uniref:HSP70/90 co-chaperone n=1 Tax=Tieghemiomyces parasiticus TaxID=78921 RepID=A0A9W7ZSZ0_9FUNG|nr:HSP70/90 co-chaperone [Tieghemiomyces parasiticus]
MAISGPQLKYRSDDGPGNGSARKTPDEFLAEMLKSPLFMQEMPKEGEVDDAEANPTLAALQSLAFEGSPTEVAQNFKNQGNDSFREGTKRGYRNAIKFYTQAIAQDCEDRELTATCYVNRAAVNLELQNYRRVLNDCHAALQINPKNVKALYRSARACRALEKYEEALECCRWALEFDPANAAVKKERQATEAQQAAAEAKRQREVERAAAETREQALLTEALRERNVRLSASSGSSHVWENADTEHRVHRDSETGRLIWPVFFMYPEFKETDFIQAFNEADTFRDHVHTMFATPAPWDPEHRYNPENVELFFEYFATPNASPKLLKVGQNLSLGKVLSNPRYTVVNGIPAFIVLAKTGEFREKFLAQYKS